MRNRVPARLLLVLGCVPLWVALKAAVPAADPVGVVDVRALLDQCQSYGAARAEIEAWRKDQQAMLDEEGKKLKAGEADLDELKKDSPQYLQRTRELLKAEKVLEVEKDLLNAELERKRALALRDAFEAIRAACDNACRNLGYAVVLQYNPLPLLPGPAEDMARDIVMRQVLARRDQLDITLDVLAILNTP